MNGYDTFYETPDTVSERRCRVCGTVCTAQRSQVGPTSWAASMAKSETVHDYFYCPNVRKKWHEQALRLVQEIENTASKRVAALIQQDLVDLLAENNIQSDGK